MVGHFLGARPLRCDATAAHYVGILFLRLSVLRRFGAAIYVVMTIQKLLFRHGWEEQMIRKLGAIAISCMLVGTLFSGAQPAGAVADGDTCWDCIPPPQGLCITGLGQGFTGCHDDGGVGEYCSTIPFLRCNIQEMTVSGVAFMPDGNSSASVDANVLRGGCGGWVLGVVTGPTTPPRVVI